MGISTLYLATMGFGYAFLYLGAHYLYVHLSGIPAPLNRRAVYSVVAITALFLVVYTLSYTIPDPQLQNRVLHGVVGGFLATLACFLAAYDSGIALGRLRFAIITGLFVTALGVANELAELGLYLVDDTSIYVTRLDTWYDLVSNTAGILAALALVLPFVKRAD